MMGGSASAFVAPYAGHGVNLTTSLQFFSGGTKGDVTYARWPRARTAMTREVRDLEDVGNSPGRNRHEVRYREAVVHGRKLPTEFRPQLEIC